MSGADLMLGNQISDESRAEESCQEIELEYTSIIFPQYHEQRTKDYTSPPLTRSVARVLFRWPTCRFGVL